jgi:hypothetical protein
MARRCFWSSISLRRSALLSLVWVVPVVDASSFVEDWANAGPVKGSNAAMATATARLLFTLVLLVM